jgi:hypothetical protein
MGCDYTLGCTVTRIAAIAGWASRGGSLVGKGGVVGKLVVLPFSLGRGFFKVVGEKRDYDGKVLSATLLGGIFWGDQVFARLWFFMLVLDVRHNMDLAVDPLRDWRLVLLEPLAIGGRYRGIRS